jgi:hypothetical protein
MEENKLVYYNVGTLDENREDFKIAIKQDFGICEEDLENVVGGYRFLFDEEIKTYVRAEFVDNGHQIKISIIGEIAEEVLAVYKSFVSLYEE